MHLSRCDAAVLTGGRAALQEEGFKHREDVMKAKNSELEESLIRFSKYLQENDAKRARAFKKATDERRLCEEKSAEAEELVPSLLSFTTSGRCHTKDCACKELSTKR